MRKPFSFAGPQPKQAMFGAYVSCKLFPAINCFLAPLRLGVKRSHAKCAKMTSRESSLTVRLVPRFHCLSAQLLSQFESLHLSRGSVRQLTHENISLWPL